MHFEISDKDDHTFIILSVQFNLMHLPTILGKAARLINHNEENCIFIDFASRPRISGAKGSKCCRNDMVAYGEEYTGTASTMQRYASKVLGNKTNLDTGGNEQEEQEGEFSAASLSMRAQKKIASKLSTRKTTKFLLSESVDRVFDSFYNVLRTYYTKKDSEEVVKNIIKLAVKLALLARNDLLSEADIVRLANVQKQLHSLILSIISFVQVRYSFERTYLIDFIKKMQGSMAPLVCVKLSDKSTKRLEHVVVHLTNVTFLDALFKVDGPHAEILAEFISGLEVLLDSKQV